MLYLFEGAKCELNKFGFGAIHALMIDFIIIKTKKIYWCQPNLGKNENGQRPKSSIRRWNHATSLSINIKAFAHCNESLNPYNQFSAVYRW